MRPRPLFPFRWCGRPAQRADKTAPSRPRLAVAPSSAYRSYRRHQFLRRMIASIRVVQNAMRRRQAMRHVNQLRHERLRRDAAATTPTPVQLGGAGQRGSDPGVGSYATMDGSRTRRDSPSGAATPGTVRQGANNPHSNGRRPRGDVVESDECLRAEGGGGHERGACARAQTRRSILGDAALRLTCVAHGARAAKRGAGRGKRCDISAMCARVRAGVGDWRRNVVAGWAPRGRWRA